MKASDELFKVQCPLGVTVSLDRDCWYGHILKRHYLGMKGRLKDVEATLAKPDVIFYNGKHDRTNHLYWKEFSLRSVVERWLKVVVWVVDVPGKKGIVMTAFPALFPPGGGIEIWHK